MLAETKSLAKAYVLIVEDDDAIRDGLSDLLVSEGFEVREAINGLEALAQLERCEVPPGLIILDMMMPIMDGWGFLERHAASPTLSAIPVAVLSAVADRSQIPPARYQLRKPIDIDDLLRIVEAHCA